jgi:hypothetical protein
VVGRIRCSRPRGRVAAQALLSGWSVAIAQTKPASSRRRRGRSSAAACRGRPSAASADRAAAGSATRARQRQRPGRAGDARVRSRPSAGGGACQAASTRSRRTCALPNLGDRALPALLAGGVLGGHQADEGHQLLGGAEAIEVADLGHERERGPCRSRADNAAERPAPATGPAQPSRGSRAPAAQCARRRDRRHAGRCRRSVARRRTRTAARRATCVASPSRRWSAAAGRGGDRTSTAAAGRASDQAARPRVRAPDREPPLAAATGHRSAPAARRRATATLRASRGSVFTRSPGRCGTSPGATTRQSMPRSTRCR